MGKIDLKKVLAEHFSEKPLAYPAVKLNGVQFFVKALNVGNFSEYLEKQAEFERTHKGESSVAYLLALMLCDENGVLIFSVEDQADLDFLASLPSWFWVECNRVFNLKNTGKKSDEQPEQTS